MPDEAGRPQLGVLEGRVAAKFPDDVGSVGQIIDSCLLYKKSRFLKERDFYALNRIWFRTPCKIHNVLVARKVSPGVTTSHAVSAKKVLRQTSLWSVSIL